MSEKRDGHDDVIDIASIFGALWRGKWIISSVVFTLSVLAVFYVVAIATPLYRSTAVVIMEPQQETVVDLQSVVGGFSGDTTAVNSEVEVLRARSLMTKVVDRLDLMADPEFNEGLVEKSLFQKAKVFIFQMLKGESDQQALSESDQETRTKDAVVSALLDAISIRNIPSSFVFEITAVSHNAKKAALIADTVVELYIINQLETKFEATEQATKWLTERVTTLQVQLEEADAQVASFSAGTSLVSVEALQGIERQVKVLRDRIEAANADNVRLAQELEALNAATTREEQTLISGDSQLERLLLRAASDPDMATAFDTRFEQVKTRTALEADRARQQAQALQDSLTGLEEQISSQGNDLIALQQLQREAEANRLLYEYFLGRLKETSAQEGIQQADSRKLSDSVVPTRASEPRRLLVVMMAAVFGGLLSSAWVIFRETRNNSIRTAQLLEELTGMAVLGQIPSIPARGRQNVIKYLTDKPTSAAAEAIRNLRTSIFLSNVDNPPQIIMLTSSVPGEGKTTNSLALTHNLIGLGKKVLLMEGDIRRRTFNEYFDNIPDKGFISYLSGDVALDDIIFRAPGMDADLLVGEKSSVNAADVFASEKFKTMMMELRGRYDTIIIDTPPVLVVPDARIIAKSVDAVLFSVKWDSTTQTQVKESMRLFRDSNQKVAGFVLSEINPKGMKRYGYGGEYGAYAGYGSKYYDS